MGSIFPSVCSNYCVTAHNETYDNFIFQMRENINAAKSLFRGKFSVIFYSTVNAKKLDKVGIFACLIEIPGRLHFLYTYEVQRKTGE